MHFEIEEIKRKRKKLGITQKKLAELVGVSQPLIARIESGDIDPKLSLVKKIFEVLDSLEGKKVNAKSVMNPNVMYVSPNQSLRKVIEVMLEKGISQMPVFELGRVLGTITESSILEIVLEKGPEGAEEMKVKDCMESPLPTVQPDEKLEYICKMLIHNPAVLVVEKGEVRGIITKHDIMKAIRGKDYEKDILARNG
ncbi:transcriptional regulator, XRE family [Archaeoglobus sulfaticallidus PM70-1]|uniref:Transcriptional regulator, XRE family n=1 Tax=Archaeoglobus sulfaticallidus PM70-1 TaxID=387631 RepID=N0BKG8_9EURY|nr:CBS domain-containing protein [Archaeoglobus sulfaticallidus]AGK60680.1 transcriptional regulator, XRE family [Archaeoglobus sulfaticallidus PM70-1]